MDRETQSQSLQEAERHIAEGQQHIADQERHRHALEKLAPPSILVDASHRVLHMSENAGRFLQPSGGPLSGNVVDLVRPELRFELRSALHRVLETSKPWLSLAIPVRFNGAPHRVLMHVKPADDHDDTSGAKTVVLFIEGGAVEQAVEGASPEAAGNEIITGLREELQQTQARLRTTCEESESANEELRAANAELQSINEELQTFNSELKLKLYTVSRAHGDLSERKLWQETQLVELARDPIFIWDFSGTIVEWNRGSEELYGYSRDEAIGKKKDKLLGTIVPGSSFAELRVKLLDEGNWSGELKHRTRDGRELTIESRIILETIDGQQLALESTRDITERKAWDMQQRLLLRELTHRVKNTLSVVQSIAHQTRRHSKSYEEFTDRLDGRLHALAVAHSLLVDTEWRGADLAALAQRQVEPYIGGNFDRVRISGGPVFVPADLATPFALVFHELATNAAKYGAFSQRTGTVDLDWNLDRRNEQLFLTVTWRERGAPQTSEPIIKGFGSELIERAIPNADVRREFASDGVTYTITVPLANALA